MKYGKRFALVVAATALVAAACGSDDDERQQPTPPPVARPPTTDAPAHDGGSGDSILDGAIPCDEQYDGKTVSSVLARSVTSRPSELDRTPTPRSRSAPAPIVTHEGSGEFEAQLKVRIDGGNAPDIAVHPAARPDGQPARATASSIPCPDDVKDAAGANFVAGLRPELGTRRRHVRTDRRSAPTSSRSSGTTRRPFAEGGYEIPTTLDELKALVRSDRRRRRHPVVRRHRVRRGHRLGRSPTGSRTSCSAWRVPRSTTSGSTTRSRSTTRRSSRSPTRSASTSRTRTTSSGGVKSIVTTTFQEGGLGILDGDCYLHRQASFYGNQFPEGTVLGTGRRQPTAFYLPSGRRRRSEGDAHRR